MSRDDPALTVRIPESTREALRQLARLHRRSITQEMIALIDEATAVLKAKRVRRRRQPPLSRSVVDLMVGDYQRRLAREGRKR